ncbi:hypothetical protein CR938_02030 [Pseudoxanthomonas taiwanensis]|jgi:Uncharacterized protein conserved in bacteria|uniref:Cytoskeleton protein RodZ-like C-terminal domain-containing protein n=2 Tax=Pseudoxanthomonas taiwanensis TaxID=176598 RepID=A0A921TGV0_9GAMM|nr:helix-turn-helix domain-containing protein [Pseudoxanthomonas taiwanensis]KAF1690494.1 hypothetical protein CR938_02030 [Pseudoxanthomonas taiwanensis]
MQDSKANILSDAQECGRRLQEARTSAGFSLEEAARRLHMPVHVVRALEEGRWEVVGAQVFVRGQIRSYARLVGLDPGELLKEELLPPSAPVELVSHAHTPRLQRVMEGMGRRVVYVVITAAIAVPAWLATRSHFSQVPPVAASLDVVPPAATDAVVPPAGETRAPAHANAPYVASLAPRVKPQAEAPRAAALQFDFEGESWLQVVGRDGQVLEQGLMRAGEARSFPLAEVARVVLGNAAAVRVQQGDSIVDLTPFRRANVARFAVSSDGSVTAAE